jgi:hypothetical protein
MMSRDITGVGGGKGNNALRPFDASPAWGLPQVGTRIDGNPVRDHRALAAGCLTAGCMRLPIWILPLLFRHGHLAITRITVDLGYLVIWGFTK